MIKFDKVSKFYKDKKVLQNVSLRFKRELLQV